MIPCDRDYSLCGLGILDIDNQSNFLRNQMDLNIIEPLQCFLERLSLLSRLSQNLLSDPSPLGGGISSLNSLYSSEYNKVL